MFLVPRLQIWTGQPQGPAGIDRNNKFGASVDFYHLPAHDKFGTQKIVGPSGVALNYSARRSVAKSPAVANRPFTVVLVMAFPTPSLAAVTQPIYVGSGDGFRLDLYTSGGGVWAAWTANGVANGAMAPRDASGVFDMRRVVLVSDWTAVGQTSWWKRDGVELHTWSDTFGYTSPSDTTVMLGSGDGPNAAKIYASYVLEGNVGAAGAAELIANPWQIFKRPDARIFVPLLAGGATSYTLDAQPGSVAVTGSAATLRASRKLSASAGSVAIVGASATCKVSRKLNATAGAVTISGANADLVYTPVGASPVLSADPGSVTIVGAPATLKATRKLAADAGTITIVGAAATLVKSVAGLTLDAQPGTVTIAGADAYFHRQYKLAAQSGSISMQGASASFVYTPDLGPMTLTPADIAAIVAALSANGPLLTLPQFLALKD